MGWLRDLMLESPVPPGNYLPDRRTRLGMGRATLRGARPHVSSHQMRDLGSAHPLGGATRVVPADEIIEELEADLRTVNPPITQGWMVAGFVVATALAVVSAQSPGDRGLPAPLLVALPFAVMVALVVIASATMRTVELRDDQVVVRRWLEVRLGRGGRELGPAGQLRARMEGDALLLDGDAGQVRISTRAWPDTARRDVVDELPIWGMATPWSHRESRRAERDERRAEAIEMRRAREAASRRDGGPTP